MSGRRSVTDSREESSAPLISHVSRAPAECQGFELVLTRTGCVYGSCNKALGGWKTGTLPKASVA